jgi:hypothetical protein
MSSSWEKVTHDMSIDGKNTTAVFTLPFEPSFIALNIDSEISDAISSEYKTITSTGLYNYINNQNAHMSIDVHAISDSSLIRVEHNWTAPDPIIAPTKYSLCPNRYWKVDGISSPGLKMSAKIFYDGRESGNYYYDHGLFNQQNAHEDSIVLMYRENAGANWTEHPEYSINHIVANDKWGMVTIDSLYLGEYVFAIKGDIFTHSTTIEKITNISCKNICDGEIHISASGGTTPYTYSWDDPNNQTTSMINGLCEGSYSVTITDNAGNQKTLNAEIVSPDSLNSEIIIVPESCIGCLDGSITASPNGGSPPYTFSWDDPLNSSTNTLSGLSNTDTYSLTLRDNKECFMNFSNIALLKNNISTKFNPILYPNPTTNTLYIESNSPLNSPIWVTIRSTSGNLVYKKRIKTSQKSLKISTKKWSQGIYIVLFMSQATIYCSKKVIIAH